MLPSSTEEEAQGEEELPQPPQHTSLWQYQHHGASSGFVGKGGSWNWDQEREVLKAPEPLGGKEGAATVRFSTALCKRCGGDPVPLHQFQEQRSYGCRKE